MPVYSRIVFRHLVPAARREQQALSAQGDRVQLSREGDVVTLAFDDGRTVEVPWNAVRYALVQPPPPDRAPTLDELAGSQPCTLDQPAESAPWHEAMPARKRRGRPPKLRA